MQRPESRVKQASARSTTQRENALFLKIGARSRGDGMSLGALLQHRDKRVLMDWFHKMIIETSLSRPLAVFRLTVSGHRHDNLVGEALSTQGSRDFKAVHFRQANIQ
jgi:hypothetical protein